MTNSIYIRKCTVLIVAVLTSLVLVGTINVFVVWINFDRNYGFGEIVVRNDQDFENMYNFPGNGTLSDPYVIADLNINTNKEYAIYISWTTKHFLIKNCTIKCSSYGIHVKYAAAGTARIENNNIQPRASLNNYYSLIFIFHSPGIQIKNNDLSNSQENPNGSGIYIRESKNTLISNNSCSSLFISIQLSDSDSALIEFNFVESCTQGIDIWSCDFSIIRFNSLYFNEYPGVKNSHASNCFFHHNNFFNNSLDDYYNEQAVDNDGNTWYDRSTNEGNYWSDLVWDDNAFYLIGGRGNCIDRYPLESPVLI